MKSPTGGKQIYNLAEFKESVGSLSHLAVYMPKYGIYHHYLVISVSEDSMSVIHYSGEPNTFILSGGFAQIKEEKNVEFESETKLPRLLDFTSGLFLIQKDEYPNTEDEKKTAIKRASSRRNENDFKLSSNNCEWFVTWVLTGIGSCEQINNAGPRTRVLADAIDATVCERESFVKTFLSKGSAFAGPIDAVRCYYKIRALQNQKQNGQIDHHTFKREVTKKVAGTATATAGAMTGAMIGQVFIPIPYVGGMIGFMVGSNAGRLVGYVCSGKLYDIFA